MVLDHRPSLDRENGTPSVQFKQGFFSHTKVDMGKCFDISFIKIVVPITNVCGRVCLSPSQAFDS